MNQRFINKRRSINITWNRIPHTFNHSTILPPTRFDWLTIWYKYTT